MGKRGASALGPSALRRRSAAAPARATAGPRRRPATAWLAATRPAGAPGVASGGYEEALLSVPCGEVVTFGELGVLALGHCNMGALIHAGRAVRRVPTTSREVPWWRAVAAGVRPLTDLVQSERAAEQRRLLKQEGVDLSHPLRREALRPSFLRPAFSDKEFLVHPQAAHTHTLVYLHGRKFTGSYYSARPRFFTSPAPAGLKVVLPTAPATGGEYGRVLTEWYSDWPPSSGSLAAPRARVLALLRREVDLLGGRPERVFLGGSSQGCILGLDVFLRFDEALGGFCGVVGYWPACSDDALRGGVRDARAARPVRLLNGAADRVVPWAALAAPGVERLRGAGFGQLTAEARPGLGHAVGEQEGAWIRAFLAEVLGGRRVLAGG